MSTLTRQKLTMIYWKSEKFWLGRLREFPDIMTQGKTLKELEDNMRDAYRMMILDDVPEDYGLKEITV
jgi:predicted RNase H-like HicB family nuclease